jgi:hypothetical protein
MCGTLEGDAARHRDPSRSFIQLAADPACIWVIQCLADSAVLS